MPRDIPLCSHATIARVPWPCPIGVEADQAATCEFFRINNCTHPEICSPQRKATIMATATATIESPATSQPATNGGHNGNGSPGTALAKPAANSTAIANVAFDGVKDPLDFIAKFGHSMYASGMFGCKTKEQGQVLAMACLCEKKNPVELTRLYHLIDGKLSMRADAMLAEFRNRGGEHKLIARTPDEAAIELSLGKGKGATKEIFRLTWVEAAAEPFPWGKGGPKFLKDGSPDPAALKTNWATPRARMQMLWARVVSDGVRALMPEVVAGSYTPEEISDLSGKAIGSAGVPAEDGEIIDAEIVAGEGASRPAAVAPKPESPSPATTPAATPATSAQPPDPSLPPVTRDQLARIKALKDEIAPTPEEWRNTLVKNYGVDSATKLSAADADNLCSRLFAIAAQRRGEKTQAELDSWANRAAASDGAASDPAPATQPPAPKSTGLDEDGNSPF